MFKLKFELENESFIEEMYEVFWNFLFYENERGKKWTVVNEIRNEGFLEWNVFFSIYLDSWTSNIMIYIKKTNTEKFSWK